MSIEERRSLARCDALLKNKRYRRMKRRKQTHEKRKKSHAGHSLIEANSEGTTRS